MNLMEENVWYINWEYPLRSFPSNIPTTHFPYPITTNFEIPIPAHLFNEQLSYGMVN